MRKSSPSFCQDTPDKGSRRHWEVVMIVLTGGKDASSAYCLTTALYCPLPGQYNAIARHKTIRREKKSPLSFLLFTLHRSGVRTCVWVVLVGWRVRSTLHHSSPQIFSLAVYRLRGDCKSPGFIGRTFFYSGLQIRWDAWRLQIRWDASRKTDAWRIRA